MIGGPARNPSEPIEETAAIPGPGGVSGRLPAALNISGTPFATPSPTRNRPISAAARMADQQHRAERDPGQERAPAQQGEGPIRRLITSPATRPTVMPAVKNE